MKKFLTVLHYVLLSSIAVNAQSKNEINTANLLFENTKEVYFSFNIVSKTQIHSLTKIISIDHLEGNVVKAFANKKGFIDFLSYSIPYTILEKPNANFNAVMLKDGEKFSSRLRGATKAVSAYPTYPQYVAMMQQFAIDYPSLCRYYDLGTLPSGRKILALKITDNPDADEDEPEFLYTSTMHGDETAGYPIMLDYIDYLLSNYGTNARVTNLVNGIEIWINPLANPDGTYAAGDLTVSGATRYNANGSDLNRNYPDPQDGLHPDGLAFQPETEIFMGLADTMNFVMSANFHGGAEVANYAWDTWATDHADKNWWLQECIRFADTAQANGPAGYFDDLYTGTDPGVTNGFAWYEVNGGRQDYMHWWHQCREMTLEFSTTKLIPESSFNTYWTALNRSLLNYMEVSMYGIRGIITDQCTGKAVRAKVFISGYDYDSSFVYSTGNVGDYHRMIYPGTYNLTYSAPGYVSQTISGITVVNGVATIRNVGLQPLSPTANFTSVGPNGCDGVVSFTDLTGSASSWLWDFGDGVTSTLQNPTHIYTTSGSYTVSLNATNCMGTDAEIKPTYLTITVAAAPTVVNDTLSACTGSVSANLSASGGGILNWYDSPTGGTLLTTGGSYTTPPISSTTSYYVESDTYGSSQYGAKTDNTGGAGGYYTGAASQYEIFDAYVPFTLVSVLVYANTTGPRTIELRNSSGTVLQSITTTIPTGSSRVNLGFNVPVGSNMQLGILGTGGNLYRNSTGGAYPYTLSGVFSVTRSSASPPNDVIYYYFYYDWEVQTICNSARTEVTAVVTGSGGVANVNISTPTTGICSGETAVFNASPTNGGIAPTYQWFVNGSLVGTGSGIILSGLNNGDVVTSVMTSSDTCTTNNPANSNSVTMVVYPLPTTPVISPSGSDLVSSATTGNQWYLNGVIISGATSQNYTPVTNGNYYVIVTDVNGCASDTSNIITVLSTGAVTKENFEVKFYPNPAKSTLTLESSNENYKISFTDALGKNIYSKLIQNKRENIDLSSLAPGIYFVRFSYNGIVYIKKLVME